MFENPSRRGLLQGGAALALLAAPLAGCGPNAGVQADTVRIGYQKDGVLVITKQQKRLEPRLAAAGIKTVEWAQFPSGPPLLEALAAGGVDFGATGDTPPIFAQASGTDLVYTAAVPTRGRSSAILVPADSKISRIAELKGARIAFTRGSSAHYFAISALHAAGLTLSDVTPVYLAPSDARAAFVRGSLDAWFIWDPYYADAERKAGARVLSNAEPFVHSASFFLAARAFAEQNAGVVRAVLDELRAVGQWIATNRDAASALVSSTSGLDLALVQTSFARADFGIVPLDAGIVARQQAVADDFARLGIIPRRVKIADAVAPLDWK
ncbi:MAG: aliphatic sulfonate ABC transporter substrate-binding protein [Rhizomicrobium sp.]